ncbi:MAG TPA: plasmid stabilization protein, partial [Halomonas sp.]|nr:plasmid stabilization protein [Halomonas sp.]
RIFYREDKKRVLVLYVMREERQLRAYMLGNS